MAVSCLYRGQVMHHRLSPIGHRFTYDVASLLIDLDEMRDLRLRFLSHNRANLFSVHDQDLGEGGNDPRAWIADVLARHGIHAAGPVRVHLFPRVLGRGFTPLTTWFCHHADESLAAVLYQVRNTFGERHSYLVETPRNRAVTLTHHADKCFHVSPFIGLGGTYRFALRPPGDLYAQTIREVDRTDGTPILVASHVARRVELTDKALLRAAWAYPLLPLKILGGIHYEALRLWLKGAPFHRKPAPPAAPVSFCPQEDPS